MRSQRMPARHFFAKKGLTSRGYQLPHCATNKNRTRAGAVRILKYGFPGALIYHGAALLGRDHGMDSALIGQVEQRVGRDDRSTNVEDG